MKTFCLTDPGKVRSHNEDSVTIIKNLNDEYLGANLMSARDIHLKTLINLYLNLTIDFTI